MSAESAASAFLNVGTATAVISVALILTRRTITQSVLLFSALTLVFLNGSILIGAHLQGLSLGMVIATGALLTAVAMWVLIPMSKARR